MKIIDIKSSYPGIDDFHMSYEGSIENTGGYWGNGMGGYYYITTEIKSNICILLSGRSLDKVGDNNYQFEIPYQVETLDSGNIRVKVFIPSRGICNYRVSGSSAVNEPTHYEVSQEDTNITTAEAYYFTHRHDNQDSGRVLITDIKADGDNPDKYIITNHTGSMVQYGDSITEGMPVFTLPALLLPSYSNPPIKITVTPPEGIMFTWNAATNMTSGDEYKIQFRSQIDGTLLFEDTVAGNVESYSLDSADLNIEGEFYMYYQVVASNTVGETPTEARSIEIFPKG